MLLERPGQLSDLRAALAEVSGGSAGRIVLLSGEAGAGKTALLREFCAFPGTPARMILAACDPLFTPRPLGPLLDLAESCEELAELASAGARPADVAAGLLAALTPGPPTVLVLEDVHWADEATLDVVRLLARRLDQAPMLLALSYRDDQLGRSHPLRIVLGDLPKCGPVTRVTVGALSAEAVGLLARPAGIDGAELHQRTGGNPFFVTEVLASGSKLIPVTVKDAVLARVAALDPRALDLLDAVAVVPGRAEEWLVAELAEDSLDTLDDCLVSGMLTASEGWIAFRHEIARLAVEDSLPPRRRKALHRAALTALTRAPAGHADVARLAHHAEAAGDGEAVLRYAPAAAKIAIAAGARREAVGEFARALRFADLMDSAERAGLLESFAGQVGDTSQGPEALTALGEALAIYRDSGDQVGQGRVLTKLGKQRGALGQFIEGRSAQHEAVTVLGQAPPGALRDSVLARAYAGLATSYALDFVGLTLHTRQNAGATGNDPDCRQLDKTHNGFTPPGQAGSDATYSVQHVTPSGTADYSYSAPVLGGARTDAGNQSGEISDPGVIDWSLTRDTGPGAPRIGANWPVSEVTYGSPGAPGSGYLLDGPSSPPLYPASGSWYLTFNGANGQQHRTANLTVSADSNGTVRPTDSEVEQAIVNADPTDFAQEACSGPDASDLDPAVPAGDRGQGPCTDWNFATHLGTDVLVSGDQPDGNKGAPPDYQVIFDIMVKGDLGGWVPEFTAHTDTCGNGGICVFTLLGIPLAGENITSQEIWPMQENDVCVNDPATCSQNDTFGWGDQVSSPEPQPFPVAPECQSASPVDSLFQIEYVGVEGGDPNCDATPDAASWVLTPSIRYQSYFGSFWTAWRVPSSVGTDSLLNIETAAFSSGTAGIDANCGSQVSGAANATCLQGNGTHWLSEFQPGDQILLEAPNDASGNGTGGLRSFVRTVASVIDDTHLTLTSSAECLSGSDGNDCDFFNTSAYTSFMNPADGSQGDQSGMLTLPCGDGCTTAPTDFQFDIWKLTGLKAGTDCGTWSPTANSLHPPTSGCYYSNTLQFRAQDGESKGWWNASLPPETAGAVRRSGRESPAISEPWLNAPAITREPQDALAGAGGLATFNVAAKGSPAPAVQWQVSRNGAKTWSNIAGAKKSSYSVAVSAAENGYDYRAVLKNASGSRTTQWGTLSVVAAPAITKNPVSTKSLHRGQAFSFSSTATGNPAPVPTWEISLDGGATWQVLESGRPDISFSLPKTPSAPAVAAEAVPKDLVRVIYQNAYGTATSHTAVLAFTDSFPDVSVAASVSPSPAAAGYPATALITVGDYSATRATKVKAVTTISRSLDFTSIKQVSGPKARCVAVTVKSGKSATCTWASLPAHSQAKFTLGLVPVRKTKTGTIAVHATIAQKNGALGLANLTVPISRPWADLGLTGSAPKRARPGAKFADVLTVRDGGPAAASKGTLTVTLPAGYKVLKAAAPAAKCATRSGVVTCTIATVRTGHPVKLTLTLTAAKKGASTLVASLSAATPDFVLTNNSLSLSTLIG